MSYSTSLALRVRDAIAREPSLAKSVVEKKMFGGVGFLLAGNLLVGVWQDSLIVRLGPGESDAALSEPHVRPFDITGKAMKGWVMVDPHGTDTDQQLAAWIDRARRFVQSLSAK